jgi:hypothetical protein
MAETEKKPVLPATPFPDLDAAEFRGLKGELARAFLKHRGSMGLGDASDAWIVEHVDDVATVLIALTQHAMDIDDRPWLRRHVWWRALAYLSLVQLARDGTKRNEALCPECPNCRGQSLGSRICGLLACLPIIYPAALAGGEQAQTLQHPYHGVGMPFTAMGGRDSSTVQLVCQRRA